MKKLLYTSLIALAGLFAVSCQQEHIEVTYDPAAVTAQTLGVFADAELSADGDVLTTTFNPADFKMPVASNYMLYASATSDMANKVKVSATISVDENGIGHISIKQPTMNSLIFSLGGVAEEAFTVYFQLEGGLVNDKNSFIAGTVVNSNVASATFVAYSTVVKDVDLYPHVWVIGASANVGAWSHEKVYQFLYDYEKSGNVYTGLIDFGTDGPSGGFKLTGIAGWEDDVNWGSEAQAEEPEQASIQLIAGGGSKDIKCYSKRFYFFTFDTATLVLTAKYGFDNVGIVGAFNGWNAADANMKMTSNDKLHRFYIDQIFDENTELKFTCDDSWDLNWGGADGTIAGGGANIAVEAGSYRIYLDLNKGTYEFDSSMYGKDEPTGDEGGEPEPEPSYQGWGIIGDFNSWGGDVAMTETNGVWSAYFTNKDKEDGSHGGFKFRKDADWVENYGGPGDAEVYEVTLGEPFEAVAGGKNLGTPAGFYKAVLDLSNEAQPTITISEANVYSLIGEINGDAWTQDVEMTFKDGVWTSPVVTISGGFKIRHNFSWDDANTYGLADGESAAVGQEITLVQPGANITLEAGDYKVQFNPESKKMLITSVAFPEQLYMIGEEFGGWDWSSDGVVEMTPVLHNPDWGAEAEGQFYTVRYFTAGKGFKFCAQRAWSGDFWGLTTNDGYTEQGGNCVVAEDGFYLVHIDFKNEKVHVEPARVYGIGDAFGSWDEAVEANLFKTEGKTLTATTAKAGKLRMYVASTIATSGWWTREFNIIEGQIVPRLMDELAAPDVLGDQLITLDFNAGTGSITGEGEGPTYQAVLSVPGSWSVWTADAPKLAGNQQGQFAGSLVMAGESIEFKFIHDGSWIGGKPGETALTYDLGADDNMTIDAGIYWWNVDLTANTARATPITKVGIIGSFNEWSTDVEMTAGQDDAFSATVTLEANAEFKIRFNANWDLALGGTTDALSAYGGNITVAEAGTYTVTAFLNHRTITLTPAN